MIYGWMAKGHIVTNSFPSRNAVISFIIYVVEEGVKNQTTCHYNQFKMQNLYQSGEKCTSSNYCILT